MKVNSISVIIPCYNSSKTIIKCINSIFNQKIFVNEIIIIDDGSVDNTIDIVNNYIENSIYKKFIFIRQENKGPSAARNLGIKNASSDWIAFLDSDDYWMPNKLAEQVNCININPNVSLIGGGHGKYFFRDKIKYKIISLKRLCFKNFFETPTVLVKRNIFKEFLFDENIKYSEDYTLWLNIVSRYEAIYINSILSKSVIDKRSFGDTGLSSNLFQMEKGELNAIKSQRIKKNINFIFYLIASLFSLCKFLRRFIITQITKS